MNKTKLILSILIMLSIDCFAQQNGYPEIKQTIVKNGLGMGSVIAIVISWDRNKSILFGILHGLLSWLYVIYFVIIRESEKKR